MTEYTWEPLTEMPSVGDTLQCNHEAYSSFVYGEAREVCKVNKSYFWVQPHTGPAVSIGQHDWKDWLIRKPVEQPLEGLPERIGKTITEGLGALEKVRREALKPKRKSVEPFGNAEQLPDNINAHQYICNELTEMYKRKNEDYGDSFSQQYKEHGLLSSVIRLDDKMRRIKQLQKLENQLPQITEESIEDTLLDLANYAIMTVMEIRNERSADPCSVNDAAEC